MSDNGRISIIFACHLLLFILLGELNFILSPLSLHFHGDTLLILFFGLYFNRLGGLLTASFMGFLAEALHPVPHGTYVVGYLAIWLFIVWGQRRIRRQNPLHVMTLAAVAQLLWMFALTLVMQLEGSQLNLFWPRILTEIGLSFLVTFLVAWQWCKLQRGLLYSLGWNLEAGMPARSYD